MNKKKRALALGLAATQLTALSAVVAPLTAFAEVADGNIVTGADVITDSHGKIEMTTVNGKKCCLYEVTAEDYETLPETPAVGSSPAYKALGVKLAAEDTDNIAFFCAGYPLDDPENKESNIKSDGIELWLPARKPSTLTFEIRKYESKVTYEKGIFYMASEGDDEEKVALTDSEGFIDDETTKITDYTTETIIFARVRNLAPEITVSDDITVDADGDPEEIQDAISKKLTVAWKEPNVGNNANAYPVIKSVGADETKSSFETGTGYYEITAVEKAAGEKVAGESTTKTYTVSIVLDKDDPRLEFADSGLPDGWTVSADKKTLTKDIEVNVKAAPTATVEIVDTGLTGKDNAVITVKKGGETFDTATGTVKKGDVLTVTVAPKADYEFKTEPTVTVTNATSSKTDSTFTITVGDLAEDAENKVTITLTGEVVKSANVDFVTVSKGDKDPSTMSGSELTRYKENREKYTITLDKATSTVNISAAVGSMKGEATAGSPAKNALVIVEMAEKDANLKVFKGDTEITDRSWYEDGSKFLESGSADKGYVTLWISLTDDRMNGTEPVVYKFKSGKVEKTLTVTFEDTTEYELKAPDLTDAEYTVEITNPATSKTEATVTVTPKNGGVITNAEVCGVKLTPSGDGYTGKVDIKAKLSDAQKEAGTTEITLVKDDTLNVTVAARSDINAVAITKATENPATMDGTELERYQKNHALYTVTYDSTNKVATVKVPSALMTGTGATGSSAANVCLVMKLEAALTADQKTAIISKGQIEAVDIADGWKFVDGATEADADKYMVLWIGAGTAAITGDTKIVIYEDNGTNGKVIATVNLVKIPVVTTNGTTLTRVDLADKTAAEQETAIITEAKKKLTLPTGVTEADLTFAVGTIPTNDTAAPVNEDVTVTVTSGNPDVLLGKDGAKVTELEITVPVTVPAAPTKYEITKADATNGSFTVTPATAAEGEEVTVTATPASSSYVLDKITYTKTGDDEFTPVPVTGGKFTMPAFDVTVTVTFKVKPTGGSSGGTTRPSGGSSRPSGGGSSSSSVDITSTINAAAKGSTITVPSGKTNLTANELDAASKNDVTIIVPINSTYSWTIRPYALPTINTGLTLAVSEGQTISQAEIGKIKGAEPVTNVISFKTYANNLGTAAKLTVTTPVKSTTSQTKFANLYKVADNGALEFVEAVKIDADGKAVLPMTESGKFALLVSNESKLPGDLNNDCTLNVTDAVASIDKIMAEFPNYKGDVSKLDLNGDGALDVRDVVMMVNRIVNGK